MAFTQIDQFFGPTPQIQKILISDMAMEIHGFIGINGHIPWLWAWLGRWESRFQRGGMIRWYDEPTLENGDKKI